MERCLNTNQKEPVNAYKAGWPRLHSAQWHDPKSGATPPWLEGEKRHWLSAGLGGAEGVCGAASAASAAIRWRTTATARLLPPKCVLRMS